MASKKTDIQIIKELILDVKKDISILKKNRTADRKHLDKKLEENKLERIIALENLRANVKDDTKETFLKYKSELITKIDPILKEVTTQREHRTTITEQVSRNSDRIEKNSKRIEKISHFT